ncbi:hypothetical protein C8D95_101303 [Silicimonas algicola]|uniref:DprA winged helix domain-containing protein n=1 Tax=Silicimonas algicola TaxID=1826607 RepID=A0A316GBY1_9RHOB|nr:hypothetical protein C8D95_101303 [Silicimonas algicola]
MLIRDGATLVRSAKDVLDALEIASDTGFETSETLAVPSPRPATVTRETLDLHQRILDRLGPSPVAEDQLIRDLKAPARSVSPEIVTLELEGRVRREPGGLLVRVS